MHKYKNNPQEHSTQSISDKEKTHKYNTKHCSNQNYFLPQKKNRNGQKVLLIYWTLHLANNTIRT